MKGKVLLLICLVVVLVLSLAASALAVPQNYVYKATFVELNGSGVSGHAKITMLPSGLKVTVWADGLVLNKVHAQEICGFRNGDPATVPPPDTAPYSDGITTLAEARVYTGPALFELRPYMRPIDGGMQRFTRVYPYSAVGGLDLKNVPLTDRVIMLQGGCVPAVYSTDDYDSTLPIAAGEIFGPFTD